MTFTNMTCTGNALSVFLWLLSLSEGGETWTCECGVESNTRSRICNTDFVLAFIRLSFFLVAKNQTKPNKWTNKKPTFFFGKSTCYIQRRTWVWIFSVYVKSWAQWCTSAHSVLGSRERVSYGLAWLVHVAESRSSRFIWRHCLQKKGHTAIKEDTWLGPLISMGVQAYTLKKSFLAYQQAKGLLFRWGKSYLVINVLLRGLMLSYGIFISTQREVVSFIPRDSSHRTRRRCLRCNSVTL